MGHNLDILIKKIKIFLYEPELKDKIDSVELIKDINEFINKSQIILANRMSNELENVREKVYTRDLFGEN